LLHRAIGERAIVSTQDPILLGDLNAPQPDIALLVPRDDFYEAEHPRPADVIPELCSTCTFQKISRLARPGLTV
jgi:hypothetical protein